MSGGIYSCKGILAALFDRERSGKGRRIELSMFDCMLSLLGYMGTMWLTNGELPKPPGSAHDYTVPWQAFAVKDGYIVVATRQENFWRKLCEVLERPALADDPRFATNAKRVKNRDVLVPDLEAIFLTRTVDDWLDPPARGGSAGGAGQQSRPRLRRAAGGRARDDRRIRPPAGRQSAAAGQSDQDVGHGRDALDAGAAARRAHRRGARSAAGNAGQADRDLAQIRRDRSANSVRRKTPAPISSGSGNAFGRFCADRSPCIPASRCSPRPACRYSECGAGCRRRSGAAR